MSFQIGSVIAKVDADISGFKKGMGEAKNEVNGFQSTMGKVGAGIAEVGKQATIMATGVAVGVGVLAKIGLESAAKFEQYQIAFTTLLKSEEKAAKAIKNIQEDAAKTPFEMAPLVMANQRLISAGVSANAARKDIINLGNAISATGGGGAELERLSTNLQQIKAVGKASALDIKQFAFAGINVYKLLADSTGKNVEQVKEMEITYEDLTKAFDKASKKGGMFEDAMIKQSKSLNGLMSTLKDVVSIGLKDIFVDTGMFDAIRNAVASFIPYLENVAVPAIKNFFAAMQNPNTEIGAFIAVLVGALKTLGKWISENQELVMVFLKGLAIALGALLVIGIINGLIMALLNPLSLVAMAITALYMAWQTNFWGFRDITMGVITAVVGFFNNILMPFINLLVGFFVDRWAFITLIFQGAWQMIIGIVQVAWAIVYGLLAAGIALLQGDWQKAWNIIKDAAGTAWEGIKNILTGAVNFIKGWGGTIFNSLVKPFEDAWNRIKDLVNKIKENLDFTKRHSPSVVDIVKTGVSKVNSALGDLAYSGSLNASAAGAAVGRGGGTSNTTIVRIDMAGAMIADRYGASQMAEFMGDAIIKKLGASVRI